MASELTPSDLAPGLLLGADVRLGEGVEIGANVVIHAGTRVGDRVVIEDGAVVGKPPRLGRRSSAPGEPPPPAVIGDGAAILAGTVVFAGVELGPGAIVGDQAHVRERSVVGAETVVGRGSAIDNDVTSRRAGPDQHQLLRDRLLGDRGRRVHRPRGDDHQRPHDGPAPPGEALGGCACGGRAGSAAAWSSAPASRSARRPSSPPAPWWWRDVPARAVVMGVPARQVREVPDEDLIERWQ